MTGIAWHWRWPTLHSELLVSQSVADVLDSHRQQGVSPERGGQLFVDPANQAGLLLALATLPHSTDHAGWSWLDLNAERCRREIESANAEGLRLVGYWHTHPQIVPDISPADINSFSRFAARYAEELPYPIAVIVGKSSKPEGIRVWSFREGKHIEATRINKL
ncbi:MULTISPECIES: Mov34/MPN/PAD-1 family protein [unclassified Serratia (in: enterobacteria)]|uniref:Mov34/MPN/PAD-1 family protein n=1 Tax=unclassified Serratia (in: enterobacteria) TaxID=2647522 RepID=UPI0030764AFB